MKPITNTRDLIETLNKMDYEQSQFDRDFGSMRILVRDPDCNAYRELNAHVARMSNEYYLVLDLNK